MLKQLICLSGVAASHIGIGILFYKLRVENPNGLMRYDLVAFLAPLLPAGIGFFVIFIHFGVWQGMGFMSRMCLLVLCSLIIAIVFQTIAMTISANIYGS